MVYNIPCYLTSDEAVGVVGCFILQIAGVVRRMTQLLKILVKGLTKYVEYAIILC